MRVGTSYSRCVKDIIDGKINEREVVVIVARTDFDPYDDEQWQNIWVGYTVRGDWAGYDDREDQFRAVSQQLYDDGKLHQPRKFGAHPRRMQHHWYELILTDEVVDSNPAAKKAWEKYQLIAGLS